MATETFPGPKLEIIEGVFITEKNLGREFVEDLRNGHHLLDYGDSNWVIVHNRQVEPESRHENTESQYHGKIQRGKTKILFGSLGGNQETSAHQHPAELWELYIVFDGALHVYIEGQDWQTLAGSFSEPARLWVPSGIPHFGITKDRPARIVILMMNAGLYPEDEHHIQLKDQQSFKEKAKELLLAR